MDDDVSKEAQTEEGLSVGRWIGELQRGVDVADNSRKVFEQYYGWVRAVPQRTWRTTSRRPSRVGRRKIRTTRRPVTVATPFNGGDPFPIRGSGSRSKKM